MENPKQQLIERLKTANNVLVSVSTNPSVDQLSAAIGLTLMLNKLGKHATAVFSGEVPSTIEFLQPEKTLEKNTDSLRDFIIALDKSKADKLRYKVEDNFVRIFITPYKTSITEKDLDFSQGDFNVEVVVALGVQEQKDLDRAITAHGRILHDATTFSLTTNTSSSLGSVNWADQTASSLCEMIAGLAGAFQADLLDGQIATSLLTGIIAETKRFSNERTSAVTMSISAGLMSAGANQQLVASKLEEKPKTEEKSAGKRGHKGAKQEDKNDSEEDAGALQIDHDAAVHEDVPPPVPVIDEEPALPQEELVIDENGSIQSSDETEQVSELPPFEPEVPAAEEPAAQSESLADGGTSRITEPPSFDSKLTANTEPEPLDPAIDPMGAGRHSTPLLSHDESPVSSQPQDFPANAPLADGPQTLSKLEEAVSSPHLTANEPTAAENLVPGVDNARDAVSDALASIGPAPEPIAGLNAQPLGENLNQPTQDAPFTMPENLVPPQGPAIDTTAAQTETPSAPPTVPPPFMPTMPSPNIQIDPTSGNITSEPQQPPAAPNANPANPQNPFGLPPS